MLHLVWSWWMWKEEGKRRLNSAAAEKFSLEISDWKSFKANKTLSCIVRTEWCCLFRRTIEILNQEQKLLQVDCFHIPVYQSKTRVSLKQRSRWPDLYSCLSAYCWFFAEGVTHSVEIHCTRTPLKVLKDFQSTQDCRHVGGLLFEEGNVGSIYISHIWRSI